MKLRTAIVEDQKPDAERLEQLLKKAFGEEEILCRRFVCGDEFLKEFPGVCVGCLSGASVRLPAQTV